MITKRQWHEFCEDLRWALRGYPEWNVKVAYKDEEVDHIENDVIYCKPQGGVPYLEYEWPWPEVWNQKPVEKMDYSRIRRTVFKYPESIPEERRLKELYRNVKITGTMLLGRHG